MAGAIGLSPRGDAYHHGNLRAALLAAGEEELAEKGVDGFTLRGCARRAGVSHAAPAHHFADVAALLTELAAIGFERLSELTERFGGEVPKGTLDHLVAIGRGYVTFAARNPHLFRLIFRIDRLDCDNERYTAAGNRAFRVPLEGVGAFYGSQDPMADPELAARVIGLWSMVQGFAELMLNGELFSKPGTTEKDLIDGLLPRIVRQFFGASSTGTINAAG